MYVVKILTWVHCGVSGNTQSNAELNDDKCVQDTRDPPVLPRYRVSSVMVRTSERTQVDEERRTFESERFAQRR